MDYTMRVPCHNCPFRREGGIRLTEGRVYEIGEMMLNSQGGQFPCHKTVEYDDGEDECESGERIPGPGELHCAGALIFAEKNDNATQMMRISERLGLYDRNALMTDNLAVDEVFDDLDEMLGVNEAEANE